MTENEKLRKYIKELEYALTASLALQRHYATLLNTYDGGARITFLKNSTWIKRLKKIGTIKED